MTIMMNDANDNDDDDIDARDYEDYDTADDAKNDNATDNVGTCIYPFLYLNTFR